MQKLEKKLRDGSNVTAASQRSKICPKQTASCCGIIQECLFSLATEMA